jgi:hypothetical protein
MTLSSIIGRLRSIGGGDDASQTPTLPPFPRRGGKPDTTAASPPCLDRGVPLEQQIEAEITRLRMYRDTYGIPPPQVLRVWNPAHFPPDGLSVEEILDRIEHNDDARRKVAVA